MSLTGNANNAKKLKDKKTPAMRLILAETPIDLDELIYFHHEKKEASPVVG